MLQISFDEAHSFLLNIYIQAEKRGARTLNESHIKDTFFAELDEAGIIAKPTEKKKLTRHS